MSAARAVLGVLLSLSYVLGAAPALMVFSGDDVGSRLGVIASGLVGIGVAAAVAPRLLAVAREYAFGRRLLAGVCGVASAVAVAGAVQLLGAKPDALSGLRQSSTATDLLPAFAQEAVSLLGFYGTLGVVAYTLLGVPRTEPARAAEQRGAPDKVRR